MPLQAKNPQDFPIPSLCPCLRFSLNPCLQATASISSPYLSLQVQSQADPKSPLWSHLWSSTPRLGSVECISIDLRMNQNLSPHLKFNSWNGTCCRNNRKVCGAYPL